jgi:hypothetical protein
MSPDRETREAELRALQNSDPAAIIAEYTAIVGKGNEGQLPASFSKMIEAILDRDFLPEAPKPPRTI